MKAYNDVRFIMEGYNYSQTSLWAFYSLAAIEIALQLIESNDLLTSMNAMKSKNIFFLHLCRPSGITMTKVYLHYLKYVVILAHCLCNYDESLLDYSS